MLDGTAASYCDVKASKVVGQLLAQKAKQANVQEVHFDNHRQLKYQVCAGCLASTAASRRPGRLAAGAPRE